VTDLRYRLNSPPVAIETINEETIAVNLETGSYYELDPVGSHVLDVMCRGATAIGAVDSVAGVWGVDPAETAQPVEALVTELLREEILVPDGGDDAGVSPSLPDATTARPYAPPRLSKYTDMQQLLLLDPVHEVDASGWPRNA
jgi:hypothetical protein